MTRSRNTLLVLTAMCGLAPTTASLARADVIFVDVDATGADNGTTWDDAFNDLQDGLAAAVVSDEVWLAAGTYTPAGPAGDRTARFQPMSGVGLYGGFAGWETQRDERDWAANETILSGDLNGDDGPDFMNNSDNSETVVYILGPDIGATILDGFIITAGNGTTTNYGGGLNVFDGSLKNLSVRHCRFIANTAFYGGGAHIDSSPTFTDCVFIGNRAAYGGAVISSFGGDIPYLAAPKFIDCLFLANSADISGGAIWNKCGEYSYECSDYINCAFIGNSAVEDGGGIFHDVSDLPGGSMHVNCLFSGNSAGGDGGAMHVRYMIHGIYNCTFSRNTAENVGGLYAAQYEPGYDTGFDVYNSILWGNSDAGGADESAQFSDDPSVSINFSYSNIQGWSGALGGVGNIGVDPLFADSDGPDDTVGTEDDDVRPLAGSPCNDAGDNQALPGDEFDLDGDGDTVESIPVDLDAYARRHDDPAAEDTGSGTPPIVDMGAYEFQDCNGNGITDSQDIAQGTSQDENDNLIPDECEDCNGNGVPDYLDIADGTSQDCNGNVLPDECEDCNGNGFADSCDIAGGTSQDCTGNEIPDDCELDCNNNGLADSCDIASGTSEDCNGNEIPDECIELECDCNGNAVPDACDIAGGSSPDCNANGVPDECIDLEDDCNGNDHPDQCDIAEGTSLDCTINGIPDECDPDCNANGTADDCELADNPALDCNLNSILDECDVNEGTSADINGDGIPDECEFLCAFVSELAPDDAAESDWFGFSVALADETAVMGSRFDDFGGLSSGSAYVFRFNGSAWLQEAQLLASDTAATDEFGTSVAILGDLVIAGAPNHEATGTTNAGAAYVFAYDGVTWVEQQELSASVEVENAHFGDSVAVSGDTIVIGAPEGTGITAGSGAAYVFRYDGSAWIEEQKLFASDGVLGHLFGIDVEVNGDVVLIGAENDHNENGVFAGASYVFRYDGSTWVDEQKLIAWVGGSSYDRFGRSGAISDETDIIMIGSFGDNNGRGAVFVFRYDFGQSAWVEDQKLKADDGSPSDVFGISVDISANIALIGAENGDDGVIQAGSAYVFRYLPDEMIWVQEQELLPPDAETSGSFGHAVAISGTVALIGAYEDDDNGSNSGSAYVFVDPLDVDCNDNGAVDFCDIGDGTSEDANGDGIPDECEPGVHNVTQGTTHETIQGAIDGASDGDEIEVDPGTYVENIDFLEKDITLRSTDPLDADVVAATIIDGGSLDTVVTMSAGVMSGFTITDGAQTSDKAGGVHATGTAVVSHNLITGNSADTNGGGVIARDTAEVHNNRIVANSAAELGGGVSARDNSLIINNYIALNSAQFGGGGLRTRESPTIRNNTIVYNASADAGPGLLGGGGIFAGNSPTILSNVIAFSTDGVGFHSTPGDNAVADYNCVFANFDGDYSDEAIPGPNDLNVDPLLDVDELHLSSSSPCIDAGDPDLVPLEDETDIDGEERILNDRVDIGCDEFAVCEGDANGDGNVDPLDSGFVLARFGCPVDTGDPNCDAADQNGDGNVDPLDSGFVLARFGLPCPE